MLMIYVVLRKLLGSLNLSSNAFLGTSPLMWKICLKIYHPLKKMCFLVDPRPLPLPRNQCNLFMMNLSMQAGLHIQIANLNNLQQARGWYFKTLTPGLTTKETILMYLFICTKETTLWLHYLYLESLIFACIVISCACFWPMHSFYSNYLCHACIFWL